MNKFRLFAVSLVVLLACTANARDYKSGALEIDSPWSRAIPKGASVAAGYMTIRNNGVTPDRLVGASTPVAGKVEIHEMTMDGGIMKMRPVAGGVEIAPGATVEFKPSAFHLMIVNVKQPIEKGKPFAASLTFEKAGTIEVEFTVEAIGATSPAAEGMPNMPHAHH
jgi:copper(I)-binding protein